MATAHAREVFESKQAEVPAAPKILLLDGQAQEALAACDAAIVASGTATLETLLSRRPMVAAYRFGVLTAFLLRRLRLVKVPYFSQPNLLLGRPLVPELLQEQVSGAALGEALLARLSDGAYLRELDEEFRKVHETLRGGSAARATEGYPGAAAGAAGAEIPGRRERTIEVHAAPLRPICGLPAGTSAWQWATGRQRR